MAKKSDILPDGTIKLKGSEYKVKDDNGNDVVFASYIPRSLAK